MVESFIPRQRSVDDVNEEESHRLEATIDDYALDGRRFGAKPLREEYEHHYGPEGVGWRAQEALPSNQAEKLAYNMGLRIMRIMVTPKGDALARSQQLTQRM